MEKRCMVVIDFQNGKGMAAGTEERIKAKRKCDGIAPAVEGAEDFAFIRIDGITEVGRLRMLFGINPIIADHFEMFIGNMEDERLIKSMEVRVS